MLDSKRIILVLATATIMAGSALTLSSAAKPPKKAATNSNRVARPDLGFSYVMPQDFFETSRKVSGADQSMVLDGPHTDQDTTIYASQNLIVNEYLGTHIMTMVVPREESGDFDETSPTIVGKTILDVANAIRKGSGIQLNYQNSARIDIASHPAVAVLAETSFPGLNDRAMVRIVCLNHRDKMYMFLFDANDTEFETRVPAFEAFLHSIKFTQPNVAPTPAPKKPINIQITN